MRESLTQAIYMSDIDLLKELLTQGGDVDAPGARFPGDIDIVSPLTMAAGMGNRDAVDLLLKHGALMHQGNPCWPVEMAAREDDLEMLMHLQHKGQSLSQFRTHQGGSLVHVAAAYGALSTVRCLHRNGFPIDEIDDDGHTPLSWALAENHKIDLAPMVKLLLELGAAHTQPVQCAVARVIGSHYPLDYAVCTGRVKEVRLLLGAGANSQWVRQSVLLDSPGMNCSLLVNAIARQPVQMDMVQLLTEHGADLSQRVSFSYQRNSPSPHQPPINQSLVMLDGNLHVEGNLLSLACTHSNVDVVRYLMEQGLSADAINPTERNALHACLLSRDGVGVFDDRRIIALHLIENGIDPNAQDFKGDTALHLLLEQRWEQKEQGTFDILDALLMRGADYSIPNHAGQTPLDLLRDGDGEVRKGSEILYTLIERKTLAEITPSMPSEEREAIEIGDDTPPPSRRRL